MRAEATKRLQLQNLDIDAEIIGTEKECLEAELLELVSEQVPLSIAATELAFTNSENKSFRIGHYLDSEFIYTSAEYIYVKTQPHRIEVVEKSTMRAVRNI